MAVWKYRGEYFYGPEVDESIEEKYKKGIGSIRISSWVKEKIEKYGLEPIAPLEYAIDPTGEPTPWKWMKWVLLSETGGLDEPKNYPGYYYWVWHNGEFFEVIGETEKYVLVHIWSVKQADALGIPRKKVVPTTYQVYPEIERWWIKKSKIRMPDKMGKGRYIYLEVGRYFLWDVYEIVKRDGNLIRVRGKNRKYNTEYLYKEIKEAIKYKKFPWEWNGSPIKDIADNVEPEVWLEKDTVYYEASLDLEVLKKYRSKMDDMGNPMIDFYLYGEEEVPYRL